MYSGPPPSFFQYCKMPRGGSDLLDGINHRLREALREFRANAFVPRQCFFKLRVRFRQPNDGKYQCFLSRPALTRSHETTSTGFCSYLATRQSSSERCSSVSAGASASRLTHNASSNSNFSAMDRLPISLCKLSLLQNSRRRPVPGHSLTVQSTLPEKKWFLRALRPAIPAPPTHFP